MNTTIFYYQAMWAALKNEFWTANGRECKFRNPCLSVSIGG